MNVSFAYKNFIEDVSDILDLYGTTDNTNFGTAKIADFDLNTSFRSNGVAGLYGTTTIRFNFGSSVYVDSLIAVHNFTTGTIYIQASGTADGNDATYGLPIDSGIAGTSVKFLTSPVSFKYWKLFMAGNTSDGYHELKEAFIGKKLTLNENPSYPFEPNVIEDTIMNMAEKGQRFIYHNFSRKTWELNYEGITESSYLALSKMRRYCRGSYKPLWFCIDYDNDPLEIFFTRMIGNEFSYKELTVDVWDVSFRLEEEL